MEEIRKSEFLSVVEETRLRLKDNSEWRARYASYAEKISDNLCFIKSVRSSFHEWSPLKVYLNVTSAKTAKNSVSFELRYMGQATDIVFAVFYQHTDLKSLWPAHWKVGSYPNIL